MDVDETQVRLAAAAALLTSPAAWRPLPHQVPPDDKFYGLILIAGRGSGKTDFCSHYVAKHVNGPPCLPGPSPHWVGIIAPTLGDAATSCYAGPSGIRAHDPTARLVQGPGGMAVHWPNGSVAKLFGAHTPEDIERLRSGGNRCLAYLEEVSAWRYLDECWDHMRFGLRTGPHPHWVGATTPKPRPLIRRLMTGQIPDVVVRRAATYDNPHLSEAIRDALEDSYGGTTLGAQELHGELVEQDDDALWRREWLDAGRIEAGQVPDLSKITVGVDPSGGAGEQGIVVVGRHDVPGLPIGKRFRELHGYVLADRSCHLSPDGWGRRAVQAAVDHDADDIVVETNFGGAMAVATIAGVAEQLGHSIPVRTVTASRGKRARAEPVAALAERGRWHHAGRFEELETQMGTWTQDSGFSPDRIDAMVWGAWHTKLVTTALRVVGSFGAGEMNRQIIEFPARYGA